jgi:Tfp pilus assembly protein PilF
LLGLSLLLLIELALRLAGFGGPGDRPDPFFGFSPAEPLFVTDRDPADGAVLRTRDDRIGPFNRVSFPVPKPAAEVRLFCLGGSSTFGFPFAAENSFCRDLELALQAVRPERRIRVLNCGGMSYGSRRVLNVMREVAAYQPDGFVIYMGHNEYVERRFFAPFLEEPRWQRRLRGALHRVRLYVALRRLLAPALADDEPGVDDLFGVGPIRDDSRRVRRSEAEDRLVEETFRFVLDEMVALARGAGAPLFLIRPAANLRDWAPEASDFDPTLTPDARQRRDEALARAGRLHERGMEAPALEAVDDALSIDSSPAAAHYLRGRILLALGRQHDAGRALRQARDRDAVPIRIIGALSAAIGEAWEHAGVAPLDAEAALGAASPHRIVGHEMILDYCHPTREGHWRIAALVLPQIQAALWPGEAPRLVDWNALPGVEERGAETRSAFGVAWAGQMALRQGDAPQARQRFEEAIRLDAGLATAHEGLGRALAMAGELDAAIAELETATRLDPRAAPGWNNLGLVYRAAGRASDAVRAFRRALEAGVGGGVVRRNLAGTLLELGRLEEARREIERAIEESPADSLSWVHLGEIAARQGDESHARRAFERALELDPSAPGARAGLARVREPEP